MNPQTFDQIRYDHRQAQTFERATLEARDTLRPSKDLAQEFLTKTRGNQFKAMHLNLRYVRSLFPAFVPRTRIGSPAEKLYNRIQKAVEAQAKNWTYVA